MSVFRYHAFTLLPKKKFDRPRVRVSGLVLTGRGAYKKDMTALTQTPDRSTGRLLFAISSFHHPVGSWISYTGLWQRLFMLGYYLFFIWLAILMTARKKPVSI
jgi:hypothetical protein